MIETVRVGGSVLFVALGLFFTLISTVGVLRLPDVYSRAHTASQADTLGAGFALAGVALALGWTPTTILTVILLFFIFVTNPTAAHAITRAAHEEGIEPWTTDDDRTDADLAAEAERLTPNEMTDTDEEGATPAADGGQESGGESP
ncbi:monovalent cation/H(+) antiporter subunit G [Halovenus sp. HT40]|uniref:monovalent cation/H(+) antiporter subunit G n=1 Tax=Halovenus sp. HT40 TaxID=3126691 RepID=UPI003FA58F8A